LALGDPATLKLDGIFYRGLRVFVRAVAWILFRFKVVGVEHLPPTGAAVVVANHQSWLDPILLPLALPRKPAFLAMEELWRMPVIGTVMRVYGPLAVPLNRGAVDATALKRSLRALQGGALLIIFPEGGISPDGRLRPFHRGAAMLAARAKVPLIPVAIQGTADALPLGRMLPRRRPITVRIGRPIAPPGPEREDLERASETAAAQIEELGRGTAP
jgi:1-acyl-sn-glycerol-3-phosphate acyltransferase